LEHLGHNAEGNHGHGGLAKAFVPPPHPSAVGHPPGTAEGGGGGPLMVVPLNKNHQEMMVGPNWPNLRGSPPKEEETEEKGRLNDKNYGKKYEDEEEDDEDDDDEDGDDYVGQHLIGHKRMDEFVVHIGSAILAFLAVLMAVLLLKKWASSAGNLKEEDEIKPKSWIVNHEPAPASA
jgi:hypothetical protein